MASSVKWRWFLANSSNFSLIGELNTARSRSLTLGLNKSESASFTLSTLDSIAPQVVEASTCLLCYRNNKLQWSGPIWTVKDGPLPDISVNVTAVGWYELLNKRLLRTGASAPPTMPTTTAITHTYASIDAGVIALDLLARTNAEAPTGIAPGSIDITQVRNITYNQYQNVGKAITDLTALEAGFDWRIDPATRQMNILGGLVKSSTQVYGRGQDRPNAVFGYGRWGPRNLQSLGRDGDASVMCNDMTAIGQYGAARQSDPGSQATYGLFEDSAQLSDVVSSTILSAFAASEVLARSTPQKTYTFSPMPYTKIGKQVTLGGLTVDVGNVPQPFVDYDIGDFVYLGANYGRMVIPAIGSSTQGQPVRVFGFKIDIDDQGVEQVNNVQTLYQATS